MSSSLTPIKLCQKERKNAFKFAIVRLFNAPLPVAAFMLINLFALYIVTTWHHVENKAFAFSMIHGTAVTLLCTLQSYAVFYLSYFKTNANVVNIIREHIKLPHSVFLFLGSVTSIALIHYFVEPVVQNTDTYSAATSNTFKLFFTIFLLSFFWLRDIAYMRLNEITSTEDYVVFHHAFKTLRLNGMYFFVSCTIIASVFILLLNVPWVPNIFARLAMFTSVFFMLLTLVYAMFSGDFPQKKKVVIAQEKLATSTR